MLRRDILKDLTAWKANKNKRALLILGARQVGKTYIVREFAKDNYESFIELNFSENPSFKKIFEGDLNIQNILANFTLYIHDCPPLINGKTLIFLDEIQECPKARTALKFFTLDKRFDVIASGSLLGVNYSEVPSYPTGYVEYINMYPLSFKEFLYGFGVGDDIIGLLKESFENVTPLNAALNDKMLEYFKQYIVIGGMPHVVNSFLEHRDYAEVTKLQKQILFDYRNDITKYAFNNEKVKATACFDSIPAQLAKENKKFSYRLLEEGGRRDKYLGSIEWLVDAGIANIAYNLSSLDTPLIAYKKLDDFKLYLGDTGLLVSMLEKGANTEIMEGNIGIYKGAIFENIIAQILTTNDQSLYYYKRNNTLEIDFVLANGTHIYPIEVKANNNKAKSLTTILKENENMKGVKLIYGNVGRKENLITLPLYMAMFL